MRVRHLLPHRSLRTLLSLILLPDGAGVFIVEDERAMLTLPFPD